ncbi:MAG: hypothetical protein ACRDN1_11075, partial [Trebonia sp.]
MLLAAAAAASAAASASARTGWPAAAPASVLAHVAGQRHFRGADCGVEQAPGDEQAAQGGGMQRPRA